MTRVERATAGAPCWFVLFTGDAAGAREFYGAVLGWTAGAAGPGGGAEFRAGGARVAGLVGHDGADHPDGWTVHFATADAVASTDAAVAAGAAVLAAPAPVADLGTAALLADPAGAPFGLWQPGTHHGFEVVGQAGAPVRFEYLARGRAGHAAAVAFYRGVLGVEAVAVGDSPELRYTQLRAGGVPWAGVLDVAGGLPERVPPSWQVHLGVADVDAAADTVLRRGGRVLRAPQDSPFGRGAAVADPTGAVFRLASFT